MEIPNIFLGTWLAAVLPTTGYLVKRIIDTDKLLSSHMSADIVQLEAAATAIGMRDSLANERHEDLKVRLKRIEDKIDKANGGLGHAE